MEPKRRVLETGERVREEVTYESPSGRVSYDLTVAPLRDETGAVVGLTAASLDITEQKQRERLLEEYRTIVETVWDGVAALDAEDRFTMANRAFCDLTGYDREELVGEHVTRIHSEAINEEAEELNEAVIDGSLPVAALEFDLRTADGESTPVEGRFGPYELEDGSIGRVGVVRDISERKQREQELRETTDLLEVERAQLETILNRLPVGVWVADEDGALVRKNEEADRIWAGDAPLLETVDGYTEYNAWYADSGRKLTPEEYPAAKALRTGRPVEPVELRIRRFDDATGWVLVSAAPITDEDGRVTGTVSINVDITEQKHREQEFAALNRLNSVFQDVTHAIIESSSREEIEQTITEHLTNSDSYEYAWIGHLDRHGQNIVPQSGGADEVERSENPLSSVTDGPKNHSVAAEAIRSGEVQVTHGSATDPVFDQLTLSQDSHHRAGISLPISYEDRTYGVLNVYTTRESAFDERERRIIERLSEVVGHAISSLERRRALLEDRVTEVTFRSREIADAYIDAIGHDSFTISIDESIVLTEGHTITYYSVAGVDPEGFIDVVEKFYPDSECHVVTRTGTTSRVEVKTAETTGASQLAKYNSWIVDGVFENGEFRVTVGVPQTIDVREVIDLVKTVCPGMEIVAQTDVERENPRLSDVVSDLEDQLTERQRTTLEVAFYSGFFDWPRAITGEELAERLDVTSGTVSHHLRHGERKLMAAFFEASA
jgi:PAS domain S-box-containing protein